MKPTDNRTPVRRWERGELHEVEEVVAEERAVALVYNGVSHAVMMATPEDLEDLAFGFSMSENIVAEPSQLYGVNLEEHPLGIELNIEIASARFAELNKRRRNLTGRTGCGLCGAESLEQAILPLRRVGVVEPIPDRAIQRAAISFGEHQPLQALTGEASASSTPR